MGHQIIKQPNGKYAVFSSIVDNFIMVDATAEDIIEDRVEDYRREATYKVRHTIERLDAGLKPYSMRAKTWEEACAIVVDRHGQEALDKVLKLMDGEDGE